MNAVATIQEIHITTVPELRKYVRACRGVVVWANCFVADGTYIEVTKGEMLRVLSGEDSMPVRATYLPDTQILRIN